MHVTVLGGGGFLGRKIAARLAADGQLGGRRVTAMTLFDLAPPVAPEADFPITALGGDIAELPPDAIPPGTDVVFHLAAVVSAAAEADYDLGRRVNLDGVRAVIDACRALPRPPRVVFTSSVASFGGGQDAVLPDDARQVPTNSYGAQKAAGELLLTDASRRGFLDAVSDPTANDHRSSGTAKQGRQQLFLRHHPRAAAWPGDDASGARSASRRGSPARAALSSGCCTRQPSIAAPMGLDRADQPAWRLRDSG